MQQVKQRARKVVAFVGRHATPILVGASVTGGALMGTASAFATGATYSIGSVVTSTQSNIAADIPEVLLIMGGLAALSWGLRFLFKHIGSPKG